MLHAPAFLAISMCTILESEYHRTLCLPLSLSLPHSQSVSVSKISKTLKKLKKLIIKKTYITYVYVPNTGV